MPGILESSEWKKYLEELEKWRANKSNYPNETEWYLDKPNEPGYTRANND
jgi:hypothetical protein